MKKSFLMLAIFSLFILTSCDWPGQFEGKNAQEWSIKYYEENTDKVNILNSKAELQTEYDDLESEKDDLQSEFDDLQDELDQIKNCIEDYPHDAENNCL